MRYNRFIMLSSFLIPAMFVAQTIQAQTFEKKTQVSRSFYASQETEIQISNKYGNIHLVPWDKDSVMFRIDLTVRAGKEARVDKLFDNIDFEFTGTRYYVIARTLFRQSNLFTSISDMTSSLFNTTNNVQIDYLVYFPGKNPVRIENKFGNIYSTDHYGDLYIQLSNGDLKLNSTYGKTRIGIEFGNAFIKSVEQGDFTVNYGELELDEATALTLNSKSSRVTITHAGDLFVTSHRDKYFITTASTIKGDLFFSYFNVKEMTGESDLKSSYGSISLQAIPSDFKYIGLNSEYSDIQLLFDHGASYSLEILHTGKTNLSLMPGIITTQKELTDKDEDQYRTWGYAGKNEENAPAVRINMKAGSVSIIHQ
jgi:hypothetical protein